MFFYYYFFYALSNINPFLDYPLSVPKASKLKYVSNQVYDYSYKVETDTHLSHTPQHSTKLLVEALAQVHVISTCEMVLKVSFPY